MLFHTTLQDHLVQLEIIELYTISVLPQDHSDALDRVFQSAVLAAFHTLALPTKLFAVGFTLLNVYVDVVEAWFSAASLTYAVLFCVHGCCAVIFTTVVVFHVLPSKLYGEACNHASPPFADVIVNAPAVHSGPELFENVNVGITVSSINVFTVRILL